MFDEQKLRDDVPGEAMKSILSVPGMMTDQEKRILFNAAKNTEQGSIVDAGCFLGLSTLCLQLGLKHNDYFSEENKKNKIITYDAFKVWTEHVLKYTHKKYKIGDSFRDDFEKNVEQYRDYVDLRDGDLMLQEYDKGHIGLLFLDICKSFSLEEKTRKLFFPHLQKGSIIIQQDFDWIEAPWIPIGISEMKDYLQPIASAGSSYVFFVKDTIPSELYMENFSEVGLERALKLFNDSVNYFVPKKAQTNFVYARGFLYHYYQGRESAISYFLWIAKKFDIPHTDPIFVRTISDCLYYYDPKNV